MEKKQKIIIDDPYELLGQGVKKTKSEKNIGKKEKHINQDKGDKL